MNPFNINQEKLASGQGLSSLYEDSLNEAENVARQQYEQEQNLLLQQQQQQNIIPAEDLQSKTEQKLNRLNGKGTTLLGMTDADTIYTPESLQNGGSVRVATDDSRYFDAVEGVHPSIELGDDGKYHEVFNGSPIEEVARSSSKRHMQPEYVSKLLNKPVNKLTDQDYIDVSQQQTIQMLADLIDPNSGFKAPLIKDAEPINLTQWHVDEHGNKVEIPLNIPITYKEFPTEDKYGRKLATVGTKNGINSTSIAANDPSINVYAKMQQQGGSNSNEMTADELFNAIKFAQQDSAVTNFAKNVGSSFVSIFGEAADAIALDLPDFLYGKGVQAYYAYKKHRATDKEQIKQLEIEEQEALKHRYKANSLFNGGDDTREAIDSEDIEKATDNLFEVDQYRKARDTQEILEYVKNGQYLQALTHGATSSTLLGKLVGSIIPLFVGAGEVRAAQFVATKGSKLAKTVASALEAKKAGNINKYNKLMTVANKRMNLAQKVLAKGIAKTGQTAVFTSIFNDVLSERLKNTGKNISEAEDIAIAGASAYMQTYMDIGAAKYLTKPLKSIKPISQIEKSALKDTASALSQEVKDSLWGKAVTNVAKVLKAGGKLVIAEGIGAITEGVEEYLQQWADILGKQWDTNKHGGELAKIVEDEENNLEALVAGFSAVGGGHLKAGTTAVDMAVSGYKQNKIDKIVNEIAQDEQKERENKAVNVKNAARDIEAVDMSGLTVENIDDYLDGITEYTAIKKQIVNTIDDKKEQEEALNELNLKYAGLKEFLDNKENKSKVIEAYRNRTQNEELQTQGGSENEDNEFTLEDDIDVNIDNVKDYVEELNNYIKKKKQIKESTELSDEDKNNQLEELQNKFEKIDAFVESEDGQNKLKELLVDQAEEENEATRGGSDSTINHHKINIGHSLLSLDNEMTVDDVAKEIGLNDNEKEELQATISDDVADDILNLKKVKNKKFADMLKNNIEKKINAIEEKSKEKKSPITKIERIINERIDDNYSQKSREDAIDKVVEEAKTGLNKELKNALSENALKDNGITLEDIAEYMKVKYLNDKERLEKSKVYKFKDELFKEPQTYYGFAKQHGVKIHTTYQSGLNEKVTKKIERLGQIRNKLKAIDDNSWKMEPGEAIRLQEEEQKIINELQEKLSTNTLFDKDEVVKTINGKIKDLKTGTTGDAATPAMIRIWHKDASKKTIKEKGKNSLEAKVFNIIKQDLGIGGSGKKKNNKYIKQINDDEYIGSIAGKLGKSKKEVKQAVHSIVGIIGKLRDEQKNNVKNEIRELETTIKIVNSGRYTNHAVEDGILDRILNAANITVDDEQNAKETMKGKANRLEKLKERIEKLDKDIAESIKDKNLDKEYIKEDKIVDYEKKIKRIEEKNNNEGTIDEKDKKELRKIYEKVAGTIEYYNNAIEEKENKIGQIEESIGNLNADEPITRDILEIADESMEFGRKELGELIGNLYDKKKEHDDIQEKLKDVEFEREKLEKEVEGVKHSTNTFSIEELNKDTEGTTHGGNTLNRNELEDETGGVKYNTDAINREDTAKDTDGIEYESQENISTDEKQLNELKEIEKKLKEEKLKIEENYGDVLDVFEIGDEELAGLVDAKIEAVKNITKNTSSKHKVMDVRVGKDEIKTVIKEKKAEDLVAETITENTKKLMKDMKKTIHMINTAEAILYTAGGSLSENEKKALEGMIKDLKDELKNSIKHKGGSKESIEAFRKELEEKTMDAQIVKAVIKKIFEGGKSDLMAMFEGKQKLIEIVNVVQTLANSMDFEQMPAAKEIANEVKNKLKDAFYHSKADVSNQRFMLAQGSVFQSLFTIKEIGNDGTINNMELTDRAAFAIHVASAELITTMLRGWVGYKNDDQIKKFFGIKETTLLSHKQKTAINETTGLREAYPVKLAQQEAGKILASLLGYKIDKLGADDKRVGEMYQQLGHAVLVYLEKQRLIKLDKLKLTQEQQAKIRGEKNHSNGKATYNFIGLADKISDKTLNKIATDESLKALAKAFKTEFKSNKFSWSPIQRSEDTPIVYKNTYIGKPIHETAQRGVKKAEHTPYTLNVKMAKKILDEFDSLATEEKEIKDDFYKTEGLPTYTDEKVAERFFGRFGVEIPQKIAQQTNIIYDERNKKYEAYKSFVRLMDRLRETLDEHDKVVKTIKHLVDKGVIKEPPAELDMFTKYFVSKNGRLFQDASGGINPQTEKEISRWILVPREVTEFEPEIKNLEKIESGDPIRIAELRTEDEANMLMAIAFSIGGSIDKDFTLRSMAIGAAIFNMSVDELKKLKKDLEEGNDIKDLTVQVPVMNFKTGKIKGTVTEEVPIDKEHYAQREAMLDALIKYKKKKTAYLAIPYEIDGKTNGTYIKNGTVPVIEGFKEMLAKTGMYTEDFTIGGTSISKFVVTPNLQDVTAIASISEDIHRAIANGETDKVEKLRKQLGGIKEMTVEEIRIARDAYLSVIQEFPHLNYSNEEMVKFAQENAAKEVAYNLLRRDKNPDGRTVSTSLVFLDNKIGILSNFIDPLVVKEARGKAEAEIKKITENFIEKINKNARDSVKTSKMVFDYGAAIKNIKKTFTEEVTNNIANNILKDIDKIINKYSKEDSDNSKFGEDVNELLLLLFNKNYKDYMSDKITEEKAQEEIIKSLIKARDKMSGISGYMELILLNYEGGNERKNVKVKVNGKEYNVTLLPKGTPKLGELMTEYVQNTHAYALERSLIKTSGGLIDLNNALNASAKFMGSVFIYKLEEAKKEIKELNRKALEKKGVENIQESMIEPTIDQMEKAIVELDKNGFVPVIGTPDSDFNSGIEMIDSEMEIGGKDGEKNKLATQLPLNDGKKTVQKTVSIILRRPVVISALAAVANTHFTDGTVMAKILEKYGVTPIHDAVVVGAHQANGLARDYSEISFKYMMEYDIIADHVSTLKRMLSGLSEDEYNYTIKELEKKDITDKPFIGASYTTIEQVDGKKVLKVKDEYAYKTEKVDPNKKVSNAEDILERLKEFDKIIKQNKNDLLSGEIYINQLGGVANGMYEYNPEKDRKNMNIGEVVNTEFSFAKEIKHIDTDNIEPRRPSEIIARREYIEEAMDTTLELVSAGKTVHDKSKISNMKEPEKTINKYRKETKEKKENHDVNSIFDNALKVILEFVTSGEYYNYTDEKEIKERDNKFRIKLKNAVNTMTVEYANFYIDLMDNVIVKGLEELNLDTFENWYNTQYEKKKPC